MGTKRTRLLITIIVLIMSLIGMILGFIMNEANVVITSLGTASATAVTYITGKSWNNTNEIKHGKNNP